MLENLLSVGLHDMEDHFVLLDLCTWHLPEIGIKMHISLLRGAIYIYIYHTTTRIVLELKDLFSLYEFIRLNLLLSFYTKNIWQMLRALV